jgi:hypothetical protein
MACEEEFNALRQAQQELARHQQQHPHPDSGPPEGSAGSEGSEIEALRRLAELTAAVQQKQAAYDLCRGRTQGSGVEALMRDDTGRPLGGGAGPPM